MHSIRKYRTWAVLLLVVLASTAVVASTPGQSTAARSNAMVAPSGVTSLTLTKTGPVQVPSAISPVRHPGKDGRNVAMMGADYTPLAPTLYDSLVNYYGETVTRINVMNYTPTLAEMESYDVCIVWSNYAFSDPNAIGDRLADYIDNGGRVVLSTFAWYSSVGWGIGGRIKSDAAYQTFTFGGNNFGTRTPSTWDSGNPITVDLNTSLHCYYSQAVNTASGATWLASWDNSTDFVALSANGGCVGINMYPGSADNPAGPWCKLYDNAIEFSVGPPQAIDIGCTGMTRPNDIEDPGTVVTPRAKVKNFGTTSESNFWVHATIDDNTDAIVYADSAKFTGTLGYKDTGSVALPDWTVGSELVYSVRMFTALPGDTKPKNDTAKKQVGTVGWKDIQAPTDDPNRLVSGSVYDNDHDMLYMMGGNTDGYAGTNLTRMQRYDPQTQTWSNRAALPTAVGWIHGDYVNGSKVNKYLIKLDLVYLI
jgi:hypothetical protein